MKEVFIKKRIYEITREELAEKLNIKGKIINIDDISYYMEDDKENQMIRIEVEESEGK